MIAGYIDRKMREIAHSSGIMSQSRIAILAALNIADELFQEREKDAKTRKIFEKQATGLSELLDSKLGAAK
jgi:cell division protein ZapA